MIILMYGFWLTLNGRLTGEIMLLGIPVAGIAMLFMCKFCDWSLKKEWGLYRCLPLIIAYLGVLLWEILKANLAVSRVVYKSKPDPVVRTVTTSLKSRMGRLMLANSITLTPGTITLTLKGDEITIHCLTPEMADGLDNTVFEKRLKRIEEVLHG